MNTFLAYINDALAELRQVRWPTRNQAVRLSVIVLIFCAVASVFFGLVDFIISEIVSFLLRSSL